MGTEDICRKHFRSRNRRPGGPRSPHRIAAPDAVTYGSSLSLCRRPFRWGEAGKLAKKGHRRLAIFGVERAIRHGRAGRRQVS